MSKFPELDERARQVFEDARAKRNVPPGPGVRLQSIRALMNIYAAIDAKAEKQSKWLRAAIITRNRSLGQRFRHITGGGK